MDIHSQAVSRSVLFVDHIQKSMQSYFCTVTYKHGILYMYIVSISKISPHRSIIVTGQPKFLLTLLKSTLSCTYVQEQTQFHALQRLNFIQITNYKPLYGCQWIYSYGITRKCKINLAALTASLRIRSHYKFSILRCYNHEHVKILSHS